MQKNKKIILLVASILILVVAASLLFAKINNKKERSVNKNNTSQIEVRGFENKPQSNFVKCDIDGQKDVYFKIINVSIVKIGESKTTNVMAQSQNVSAGAVTPILQFGFPGTANINYTMPVNGSEVGLHYTTTSTSNSFQTNADNGDSFKINITKYLANNIEGFFSGEMTGIGVNGWDNSKKTSFQNCSFSSSVEIVVL